MNKRYLIVVYSWKKISDMKIASKDTERFVDSYSEQKKFKIIFLYGDDESSVNFKFRKIRENFKDNNFSVKDIKQEELKQDKSILSQEFFSISLFGERTLITLRLVERENDYAKCVESLLEERNVDLNDNYILITAGGLEKTSSLLKIMDKSEKVASVTCYEEAEWNMSTFISTELKKYNFVFNTNVVSYLNENIGKNKLMVENEIKKINYYKGEDKKLTLEDVNKTTKDLAGFAVNDLVNAFCSFNKKETFRLLNKFYREKNQTVILSRFMINYFLQLQRMQYCIEINKELVDNVIEAERIFWKQKDIIKIHLKKWSLKNINIFLKKLIDFEKLKFNYDGQQMVENFLLKAMIIFGK
ncbi:MAG: DNA polymerase III subunit delta, partial [Rickettsiales bacterium]|nr:DNA polymerase III subunit delta [Rickettsiales bacterium]